MKQKETNHRPKRIYFTNFLTYVKGVIHVYFVIQNEQFCILKWPLFTKGMAWVHLEFLFYPTQFSTVNIDYLGPEKPCPIHSKRVKSKK